jgi:transcription elongation factor S-II
MARKKKVEIRVPEENIEENVEEKVEVKVEEVTEKLEYDSLIPAHPKRQRIYKKFFDLLNQYKESSSNKYNSHEIQKFALNIERGIFNCCITGCKTWDKTFECRYMARCVKIYSNLNPKSYIKNVELIPRLFSREFTEFELADFTSEQIFPEKYAENMKEYLKSLPTFAEKEEQPDGMFTCGKCKSKKTTYYQLQTRSAKIIGWKSTLLITSWLCYWENSCSPSKNLFLTLRC